VGAGVVVGEEIGVGVLGGAGVRAGVVLVEAVRSSLMFSPARKVPVWYAAWPFILKRTGVPSA